MERQPVEQRRRRPLVRLAPHPARPSRTEPATCATARRAARIPRHRRSPRTAAPPFRPRSVRPSPAPDAAIVGLRQQAVSAAPDAPPAASPPGPARPAAGRPRRAAAGAALASPAATPRAAAPGSGPAPDLRRRAPRCRPAPRDPRQTTPAACIASAQAAASAHAPNSSSTARVTRVLATASSSGLRRSRWPSTIGATRRRWPVGTPPHRPSSAANRPAAADQRQFAAQPVGAQRHAQPRGLLQRRIRHFDRRQTGHAPPRSAAAACPAPSSMAPRTPPDRDRTGPGAARHRSGSAGPPACAPPPTGRTDRATAGAARLPPDCRCRSARSGRDGGRSAPRAPPRSRPRRRRPAAGPPGGPPAGSPHRYRGSRGWPGPAAPARTPSTPVSARSRSSAPTTRSSVAPSGRSTTGTGAVATLPLGQRLGSRRTSGRASAGSQP